MVTFYRPERPVQTKLRLAQVKQVQQISPNLCRITLHGEQLNHYPEYWPACHVKLLLPKPGQLKPELPTLTATGPSWPEGVIKPYLRTFTVRYYRPEAGEIDLDFAIHGDTGPASQFALNARPGDYVGLSMPGGPKPMLPPDKQYYIVGDMTALPAICAMLEIMPPHASGHVFVIVSSEQDIPQLPVPANIRLHWYIGDTGQAPQLIDDFTAMPLPASGAHFWLAGEEQLVVSIRRHLRRHTDTPRDALYAIPYWRYGLTEEQYDKPRHQVMDN